MVSMTFSKTKQLMLGAFVMGVVAILLIACGSGGEEGVSNVGGLPIPDSSVDDLDFTTCDGFVGETPPHLTKHVIGYPDSVTNNAPIELRTLCTTSILSLDGSIGLTIAASEWQSAEAARGQFATVSDSLRGSTSGVPTENPVGPNSVGLVANANGVGSMVVFQESVYLIFLSTAMPEGEAPLVEVDVLAEIARLLRDRLD